MTANYMLKATRIKSTCHPELVSGSIENNALNIAGFRNKFGMTECGEDGRSMVEMLGVLAIIGVLSIGGVYGYTTAMNKHRANELLHQVSMRATSCVAQLAMGNTTLSVADFGTYDGYSFAAAKVSGENKFSITISGKEISTAVCNNIANTVPSDVTVTPSNCGTSDATVTLTYADGTGTSGGNEGGDPEPACNGHGYKDSNDTCICVAGYSGTDCSSTLCASGKTYCGDNSGTPICCDNTTEVCPTGGTSSGTCFKAESGCTTNADCTNPDEPWCNLGAYDCETPSAGTCTELDEGTPSTEVKDGDGNIVFRAGQFLIGPQMNWFAAQNWCRAHGKELVRLSTFKISTSVNDNGWCDLPCGSSESCDYQGDYDGTSDTSSAVCKPLGSSSIMDINDAYYGKLLGYMRAAIGSNYYWTADDQDSCNAFGVYLSNGYLNYNVGRHLHLGPYALCE